VSNPSLDFALLRTAADRLTPLEHYRCLRPRKSRYLHRALLLSSCRKLRQIADTLFDSNQGLTDYEMSELRSLRNDMLYQRVSAREQNLEVNGRFGKVYKLDDTPLARFTDLDDILSSPISHLPEDILREIFSHTISRVDMIEYVDIKEEPWLLSYISSEWRRVSLECPTLWTQISIDLGDPVSARVVSNSHLLALQLSRASNLPIHLFLSCDDMENTVDHPYHILLAPTTSRWQSLYIDGPLGSMHAFSNALRAFPLLAKVEVCIHPFQRVRDREEEKLDEKALRWLQNPASIRDLKINVLLPGILAQSIPWNLIRSFHLDSFSRISVNLFFCNLPPDAQS